MTIYGTKSGQPPKRGLIKPTGVPALLWIIGGSLILGVFTITYAYLGNAKIPSVQSNWEIIHTLAGDLRSRKLQLNQGEVIEQSGSPFVVSLKRLSDLPLTSRTVARYLLTIGPGHAFLRSQESMQMQFQIGLIDLTPQSSTGELQLVALRKTDLHKVQE